MSCGYACVGCGKCKGVVRALTPQGHCPACGFNNEDDEQVCKKCGMPLPSAPGVALLKKSGLRREPDALK